MGSRQGNASLHVEGALYNAWLDGVDAGLSIRLCHFAARHDGDQRFLDIGREKTVSHMAPHVSHIGVHDHGFNNLSTYGNLRRLMLEGVLPHDPRELDFRIGD